MEPAESSPISTYSLILIINIFASYFTVIGQPMTMWLGVSNKCETVQSLILLYKTRNVVPHMLQMLTYSCYNGLPSIS